MKSIKGSEKVGALLAGQSWSKGRLQVENSLITVFAGYLVNGNLCIKENGSGNGYRSARPDKSHHHKGRERRHCSGYH